MQRASNHSFRHPRAFDKLPTHTCYKQIQTLLCSVKLKVWESGVQFQLCAGKHQKMESKYNGRNQNMLILPCLVLFIVSFAPGIHRVTENCLCNLAWSVLHKGTKVIGKDLSIMYLFCLTMGFNVQAFCF